MRTRRVPRAAVVLWLFGTVLTHAQNPTKFFAVSDLRPPPHAQPQLMGAQVADPRDFPASFYSGHDGSFCTSTLVGPRVLLTAAHCIGSEASAQITAGGRVIQGRCTVSPEYAANRTADWAVCAFESDVDASVFERLNADPNLVHVGTTLLLTGFGCTQSNGAGGNDGVYRKGEAPVVAVPAPPSNDIVTRGSVALCFGDSGGAAFLMRRQQPRLVVSVNSRGNLQDESYLASVSTPAALAFIRSWAAPKGLKICGLDEDAPRCRSVP
jgi:hypothetical protein